MLWARSEAAAKPAAGPQTCGFCVEPLTCPTRLHEVMRKNSEAAVAPPPAAGPAMHASRRTSAPLLSAPSPKTETAPSSRPSAERKKIPVSEMKTDNRPAPDPPLPFPQRAMMHRWTSRRNRREFPEEQRCRKRSPDEKALHGGPLRRATGGAVSRLFFSHT